MVKKVNKVFVITIITFIYILFFSILAGEVFSEQIVEFNRKNSKLNADTVEVEFNDKEEKIMREK